MRKLPLMFAAAAFGGLALAATPGSAAPLAGGLATANGSVPLMDEGLVQKVHSWHCRKRWSRRFGWHRHRRACYDNDYYGFGVAPFFSFQFYDDDDHRHGRKHRFKRRKGGHKNY